jgi:hypothetical protein
MIYCNDLCSTVFLNSDELFLFTIQTYPCDGSGVPGADCLWFTAGFETLESEAERLSESSSPPDPPLFLKCAKETLLTHSDTIQCR